MMHPAETYAQRLREYQWESLMLYRARSEGWSTAAVQGGLTGVTVALDRLWEAQEAMKDHVLYGMCSVSECTRAAISKTWRGRTTGWQPRDVVGFQAFDEQSRTSARVKRMVYKRIVERTEQ